MSSAGDQVEVAEPDQRRNTNRGGRRTLTPVQEDVSKEDHRMNKTEDAHVGERSRGRRGAEPWPAQALSLRASAVAEMHPLLALQLRLEGEALPLLAGPLPRPPHRLEDRGRNACRTYPGRDQGRDLRADPEPVSGGAAGRDEPSTHVRATGRPLAHARARGQGRDRRRRPVEAPCARGHRDDRWDAAGPSGGHRRDRRRHRSGVRRTAPARVRRVDDQPLRPDREVAWRSGRSGKGTCRGPG